MFCNRVQTGMGGVNLVSKTKLKGISPIDRLRSSLPPATVGRRNTGKGAGKGLMITVPEATRTALAVRAAEQGTTIRALVLDALKRAGYPVPADEITDRRRGEAVL